MLLSCLAVLLSCRLAAGSYPLKGRYGRSMTAAWPPLPVYYPPRAARPLYYPESEYYYPQEAFYYPAVDKYPVYQSVIPSYYVDQQRPYYYGYDEISEPVDDLPEDMMEEDDRSDSLPYGQESWASDSNADVNARFLQNLILAQMYNDKYGSAAESEEGDRWVYGEPVKVSKQKTMAKEDEDVRELKSLVRGPERDQRRDRSDKKSRKQKEDIFAAQTKPNNWDEFRSSNYKRSNDLKFSTRKTWQPATTVSPAVTSQPLRGQKEVVLPRPANPVRTPDFHQFSTRSSQREPSVFDTIKKLLHMEEQLDEEAGGSRLQKRSYIPSEESLVAQLGRLKKMA
ncbi:hypothetical protein J6590_070067 [Homalodisca vitripennis]|nr:hypothetical protein J6590_070067 [Homalodisca vitripennis]